MGNRKLIIGVLLVLIFGITGNMQAQNAVVAAGGEATSGGSVSYSVGQVVYNTNTGTTGVETEGVEQPAEIYIVTAVDNIKDVNLSVSVFPNPVSDFIKLKIEGEINQHYIFSVYNINGELVKREKITKNVTEIEMNKLKPASYFLKVTDNNKPVKTFKIIKN